MPDLLFVMITIAFFVVAAGFVTVCDRIIGPDPHAGDGPSTEAAADGAGGGENGSDLLTAADPR